VKLRVVIKQLSITLILSLFFGVVHSQKMVIKFVPSYSLSFGTYKHHISSPLSNIELTNRVLTNVSFSHGSFGFDLSFLEYKNISYGISFFRGGANPKLSFKYVSQVDTSSYGSTTEIMESQGNGTSTNQIGVFSKIQLNKYSGKKIGLSSNLSLYGYYQKDRTNYLPLYDNEVYMTDGLISSNYENYKDKYQGKVGVSLMLRYDLAIFLMSNNRNVLNFFVAYQQGLTL
jgi:hypothetical protein